MTKIRRLFLLFWSLSCSLALSSTPCKVCLIGTTGKLGRESIKQLSNQGIPVKCLLRHDINTISKPPRSLEQAKTSKDVAAYLNTLPNVSMFKGDVSDKQSLVEFMQDCTDCLALFGPVAPKPFWKALFPFLYNENTTPTHPKQLNYEGVRNIIQAMEESPTCNRIVRITGKGENPWSFFSILINVFGGLAKGWNYEGEQLLRKSSVEYTIIRPGILKDAIEDADSYVLGIRDNGLDMKVTAVTYSQIAKLCIDTLNYGNTKRATLTAMNVPKGQETELTLVNVQPDSREFPESLIQEHKRAARVGGLTIIAMSALLVQVFVTKLIGVSKWLVGLLMKRVKVD